MLRQNTQSAVETSAKEGVLPAKPVRLLENIKKQTITQLLPAFLRHIQYELSFSPQSIPKYKECIEWFVRDVGDFTPQQITLEHFTEVKQKIYTRGSSAARVNSVVFSMKAFMKFCKENLELEVIDLNKVKTPRRKRREVIFLSNEEVQEFIDSIKIYKKFDGDRRGKFIRLDGLRFRTLVEVLLGTGMRISEALSLDRDSIDLEKKEAKIIGKGSKERTVFFSDRAIYWIKLYLDERKDEEKPLFLTNQLTRLSRVDTSSLFRRNTQKLNIGKKITPHILRHTTATNLLFNGCPISHVKEILGHEHLETTCKYYLGVDKRKAKEAHGQFLSF